VKQKCKGVTFMKVEKPAGSEPVVVALEEIVRVLQGIRDDICELTAAVDDRWAGADDNNFTKGDSKVDAQEELSGLREEMVAYEEYLIRRRSDDDDESEGEDEKEEPVGNEEKPMEDDKEEPMDKDKGEKAGLSESAGVKA
jgi:hypothetical protein